MRKGSFLATMAAAFLGLFTFASCSNSSSGEWTENQLLDILYSSMPLPDSTDYSRDFYLKNIRQSLKARKEMPWGKMVPEREFLHFVLPVRVNNENLDESRMVFYKELKDRVKGLSMTEAALEVNHWCHEKVTYTPSDARTSSPLASIKTAYGRCGEESTFTVAAMRSVGIPARQVYTPRWAHTDDNHAWVEVWTDGQWHFLGACEPEPVLDLGWFNAPASRGMLMHTDAYGVYDGPEEVIGRTKCFTTINITSNYAPTDILNVKVVDRSGKPVEAADVEFKIYNYAELYTVVFKRCDEKGLTQLRTGLGDIGVWASKDGMFGIAKARTGSIDTLVVTLDKGRDFKGIVDLDIVPPVQRNTVPDLTAEQIALNKKRTAYEDSLRNAYVATFITRQQAEAFAAEEGTDPAKTADLLIASRGNWQTIKDFIHQASNKETALALLGMISAKDLRDITEDVLLDHFNNSLSADEYVMNPRVYTEMLTPYKSFFNDVLRNEAEGFRSNPELWVNWCRENITIDGSKNPRKLKMHPESVWNHRICDPLSREIFFVAGARSMGIPSRIDPVTEKLQYRNAAGGWIDVNFTPAAEKQVKAQETGRLRASFRAKGKPADPKYYIHFTIARIQDGKAFVLNYPEEDTWSSLLKKGVDLDPGQYVLTTGTRMADGSVAARLEFFEIEKGKSVNLELVMREDKDNIKVIGNFNSEDIYHDLAAGVDKSLLSTTGRGYYILGLIDPASEPVNHTLRDLAACAEDLGKWEGKIVLLFEDKASADRFRKEDFPGLPSNIVYGIDIDGKIQAEVMAAMSLSDSQKPIFIIADTFNRVVFLSQGYTIGLGDRVVNILSKIDKERMK